jgi:hypothetical protein
VVKNAHEQFHDGRDRLLSTLSSMFKIHQLQKKITEVIQLCITCSKTNPTTTKLPIAPIISQNPGERLVADLKMMPTVDLEKNDRYLLVVVDHFSKYSWVFCLPTKDSIPIAERITAVINEVKGEHTVVLVHTDNGREFANDVLEKVTESCGAKRIKGRPYHPQSQGVVERKNQTIFKKLVKLAESHPNEWAREVPRVVVNENNQVARTTGVRPHLLLWGYDHESFPGGGPASKLSREEWDKLKHDVRDRMYKAAEKTKAAVEKRRPATKLKVGDRVLVKTVQRRERRLAKVLEPTFAVQAVITEVLRGCKYKLMWEEDWSGGDKGETSAKSWHLKDLKKVQFQPTFNWKSTSELTPVEFPDGGTISGSEFSECTKRSASVERSSSEASSLSVKRGSSTAKRRKSSQNAAGKHRRRLSVIPESPSSTAGVSSPGAKYYPQLIPESPRKSDVSDTNPKKRRRADNSSSTSKRSRKAPKTLAAVELGQELWDNGVNGCFFNTVLCLLLAVKAWEPNIMRMADACCPLLRAMLDCVPDWDSGQVKRNKPTERVGVAAELSRRARALREECCVLFNASQGARGDFGGPHSVWEALFTDTYNYLESTSERGTPSIALPTAAELAATVQALGCPASRHTRCEGCGKNKTANLLDISGLGCALLRPASKKRPVTLGEAVQNLITAIEPATSCSRNVTIPSLTQPGALDTARCRGERSMSYSDASPGLFFVLWFEDVSKRDVTKVRMPQWQSEISLALGGDRGTVKYRVAALISYTGEGRDHFVTKLLAPDLTWWCYNGLANGHCSVRIPDVDVLTTLDVAVLFHRT